MTGSRAKPSTNFNTHLKWYDYLHDLSICELRELARNFGISRARINKLYLVLRITLLAAERLKSADTSAPGLF